MVGARGRERYMPMEDIRRIENRFAALVDVGEAACALKHARDLLVAGEGNTIAAATLFILAEASEALTRELGPAIVAAGHAPDAPSRERHFLELPQAPIRLQPAAETVPPSSDDPPSAC